jgi:F-type H+-transporting ATPase subunit delta
LAKEAKKVSDLEKDLDALGAALEESNDFRELLANPVYSREQLAAAVSAIGNKMKLTPMVANTLGLMAQNRRLFVLPKLVSTVKGMIADERGEVTAEVTAAKKLTKAQSDKLAKTLKATVGKDVVVNVSVDDSLIGGLIVKVGSKMIDSSIKSQLSNLKNAMKEVG